MFCSSFAGCLRQNLAITPKKALRLISYCETAWKLFPLKSRAAMINQPSLSKGMSQSTSQNTPSASPSAAIARTEILPISPFTLLGRQKSYCNHFSLIIRKLDNHSEKRLRRRPLPGKTVKFNFLGTGIISVMPVLLLQAYWRGVKPMRLREA